MAVASHDTSHPVLGSLDVGLDFGDEVSFCLDRDGILGRHCCLHLDSRLLSTVLKFARAVLEVTGGAGPTGVFVTEPGSWKPKDGTAILLL